APTRRPERRPEPHSTRSPAPTPLPTCPIRESCAYVLLWWCSTFGLRTLGKRCFSFQAKVHRQLTAEACPAPSRLRHSTAPPESIMMETIGSGRHRTGSTTMRPSSRDVSHDVQYAGAVFTAWLGFASVLLTGALLWAGPPAQPKTADRPHDAEQGRAIFNGKGLCSTCHGVDGHR